MAPRTATAARPSSNERFGLFAECLLTGLWLLITALPLVTLIPAFAAACGHLRRHLAGERSTRREFAAGLREAVRTGWRWSLLWWGGLALLAFDIRVARSGALPGGGLLAAAGTAAELALVVAGLRTAALREPGADWGRTAREALRRTCLTDRGGSLLLIGGLAVVTVAAWQLLPLAAPALGCLAACAVAVERRYDVRRGNSRRGDGRCRDGGCHGEARRGDSRRGDGRYESPTPGG